MSIFHPEMFDSVTTTLSISFVAIAWTYLLYRFYNSKIIRSCIGYYNEYGYVIELFINGYYKETIYVAGNNKGSSAITDQVSTHHYNCLPLNTIREYCLQTIISICNEHGYENHDVYQKMEIQEVNPSRRL